MVAFITLLQANKLSLPDKQVYYSRNESVNLLSAHKSKGLEFKHVFVINIVKSEWASKGNSSNISFPSNIPLLPDKDEDDDRIRIFFVAITRAKGYLYLSSYHQNEDGKEAQELPFAQIEWQKHDSDKDTIETILSLYVHASNTTQEITDSHKKLLADLVDNYALSVTHLLNYLDVSKGGPRNFLETNLLRFPQAKSRSATYGTAVHNALRGLYIEFARTGIIPSYDYLIEQFDLCLLTEGLNKDDLVQSKSDGRKYLKVYYEQRHAYFDKDSIIERNFKYYNVRLGEALITGKLDKMDGDKESQTITVTDFKTGKAMEDWKQTNQESKIKSWRYENQLIFYKLLVESSSEFGDQFRVHTGVLEFIHYNVDHEVVLLTKNITEDEAQRLDQLIKIVYNKIINLDFPDTSSYPDTLKGVEMFIDDLISGKV
jgi:DNA helicase-2/ATP-dependent DNA helicase PcrA